MNKCVPFLFTVMYLVACHSIKSPNNCLGSNTPKTKQIIKNIPLDLRGNPTLFEHQKQSDSMIGLCAIDNGFQDLQIRINYGFHSDSIQTMVIKKENGEHSALFYTYKVGLDKNGGSKIDYIAITTKKPKSGWESFLFRLFSFDLMTLPDKTSLNNYPPDLTFDGVTVQIATPDSFRIYNYIDVSKARETVPEAKKMENILLLIEEEFNFKRIDSSDSVRKKIIEVPFEYGPIQVDSSH